MWLRVSGVLRTHWEWSEQAAWSSAVRSGGWAVAEEISVPEQVHVGRLTRLAVGRVRAWTGVYRRQLVVVDACSALAAGWLAFQARFGTANAQDSAYFWLGIALPGLWLVALEFAGASDERFVGVGSDEFRRVVNAGMCLTAVVAITSYATKTEIARGYVVVALPCLTLFDLGCRYWLRRRLHKLREQGACMRKVVIVGHEEVISELTAVLRRETYHGMTIVAACVVGTDRRAVIDGIPIVGGLSDVTDIV